MSSLLVLFLAACVGFTRALQRLASHGVEHHIDVMDGLVEAHRGVVHHLVGAELARQSSMARRGGPDGMRPRPVRQLDRKTPNAAGGAMNQDPLAGGKLGMLDAGMLLLLGSLALLADAIVERRYGARR